MSAASLLGGCAQHKFDFSQSLTSEKFAMGGVQTQFVSVAPKVDLLWIVDDSGSMANAQIKLQSATNTFVQKYLVPSGTAAAWDIQIASIAVDAYKAGSPTVLTTSGSISFPLSMAEAHRASVTAGSGIATNSIISTVPGQGETADQGWWTHLGLAFNTLMSRGTSGWGIESPESSVKKFIEHNEANCGTANPADGGVVRDCFFRKDTIWVVAMISDEEDNLCVDFNANSLQTTEWNHYLTTCTDNAQAKQALDSLWVTRNGPTVPKQIMSVAIVDTVNPVSSPLPTTAPVPAITGYRAINLAGEFAPGSHSHSDWIAMLNADPTNKLAGSSKVANIYANDYGSTLDALGSTLQAAGTIQSEVYSFTLSSIPNLSSLIVILLDSVTGSSTQLSSDQYILTGAQLQILKAKLPAGFVALNSQISVTYSPSLAN